MPFFQFVFAVAVGLYTSSKQKAALKKAQREQEAAADKRRGSEFEVKNDVISLPIAYGRTIIAGVQYDHRVSKDYNYVVPENGTYIFDSQDLIPSVVDERLDSGFSLATFFDRFALLGSIYSLLENLTEEENKTDKGGLAATVTGTKDEFLFCKRAICHAGISEVIHAVVDNKAYSHKDYKFGQRFVVYPNGGPSALLQDNGYPDSESFTNVCHAAEVFRLDREEANYSSAPQVQYLVKGQAVYSIEENVGVYTLSASKAYSNNPAYVLLDYLTNTVYGRGMPLSEINLESFYNAALVCDTVVLTAAQVAGNIWGSRPLSRYPTFADFPNPNAFGFEDILLMDDQLNVPYYWNKVSEDEDKGTVVGEFVATTLPTADIKLFECNLTLETQTSIRDNIEEILSTMGEAELTWDASGSYKLLLDYPTTQGESDALVTQTFTEDDLLRTNVETTFPNAVERYNFVTVSFKNENKNFKSDTVSWPQKGDSVYATYLAEDNGQPFETSVSPKGITDAYHALAYAEQLVRASRSLYTISVDTNRKGVLTEPGDFIRIDTPTADIASTDIFLVKEVQIGKDFNTRLIANKFDFTTLAWNIADGTAYPETDNYDFRVPPVTNLQIGVVPVVTSAGVTNLSWDFAEGSSYNFEVSYRATGGTDFLAYGTTRNNYFEVGALEGFETTTQYDFRVVVISALGTRSLASFLENVEVLSKPGSAQNLAVADEIYNTNTAAGIKSRAILSWSTGSSGTAADYYTIEYKLATDVAYTNVGVTNNLSFTFFDLKPDIYNFKVTPTSYLGLNGTSAIVAKLVQGLLADPQDPTGFSANVNEGQIQLSWDVPTDLDVLTGGRTEIRTHPDITASATWETATTLVESVAGNNNNKTIPAIRGTYFIKHIDSSNRLSVNAASAVNLFVDNTFRTVTFINEDASNFAGVKTNCNYNSLTGNLEIDAGQTSMTYDFENVLDFGEIEQFRVTPSITATVSEAGVNVADYVSIADLVRFVGDFTDAALRFEISQTQDDPTGSPVWTPYETFHIGSYTARALRFRFVGTALNNSTLIAVQNLDLLVERAALFKTGQTTSSSSGDVTVTYTDPFYGGLDGLFTPSIALQIIGGSQGDEIIITSKDKDGFTYSVYNSASRVVRTLDWQALGQ